MKKVVFTLLIAVSSAFIFSSCTEEEISPNTENGGGSESVIILK